MKYLVANGKLQPRADVVLHVLIARMLDGAGALAEPATRIQGVARPREALERYPQYFDHPGWQ